jgi:cytochrome c oxidase cbb3-type subunit 3
MATTLMNRTFPIAVVIGVAALLFCPGCGRMPGRPTSADIELKPDEVHDFDRLFQQNCSGCHGENGRGNGALALNNPVYFSIADDSVIRRVTSSGVPGTMMPAFSKAAGGMLTSEQIGILVREMRARWSKASPPLDDLPPAYSARVEENALDGAKVYATYCSSCHGPGGNGGGKGSAITDASYLALVSNQGLRTTIIAGRPDLKHPDWRSYIPGRPMTDQAVTDLVAWLATLRVSAPGQPYPNRD